MSPYLVLQIIIYLSILLLLYNVIFVKLKYKKEKGINYVYSNLKMFIYFHILIIVTLTYFGTKFIYSKNYDQVYYYLLLATLVITVIELFLYPIFIYKFYYIKQNVLYRKHINKISIIKPKDIKSWSGYYYKKHLVLTLNDDTELVFEKGLVNLHLMIEFLEKNKIKEKKKQIT